eukprot:SAG11_NODE_3208_length_2610_cov_1.905615_2_plen_271_part_00
MRCIAPELLLALTPRTCRREFEAGFKASIASKLGGGSAVNSEDIVITSIRSAASRRTLQAAVMARDDESGVVVDFHIEAPEEVMENAASLFTTLASTDETIEIVVNGLGPIEANTSAMASPVVTRTVLQQDGGSGIVQPVAAASYRVDMGIDTENGAGDDGDEGNMSTKENEESRTTIVVIASGATAALLTALVSDYGAFFTLERYLAYICTLRNCSILVMLTVLQRHSTRFFSAFVTTATVAGLPRSRCRHWTRHLVCIRTLVVVLRNS